MNPRKLKVRFEIRDDDVRQEFTRIITTLKDFSIYGPGDSGKADVLILQLGDQPEEEFNLVHQAINSGIGQYVFLTSKIVKPEILIEAMKAGVKEFFPQPINSEEVKRALLKLPEKQSAQGSQKTESLDKQGRIINVIGSKGGVGTTTVAVNLATNLTQIDQEKSVALIDMNLLFGEIPMFLGIESNFDWVEVARNIYRIDATYLMSVMSHDESGAYVLPSPAKIADEFLVNSRVIEALLVQMKSIFDYIVIDSGQSLDEISKTIIRLSDSLIIVTLLSLPCLVNVKKLQAAFRKFGYPSDESIKILVNRHQKRASISTEDAEKSLKTRIFWSIPNDFQATMSAINQGRPLTVVEPTAEITSSFRELAAILSGRKEKRKSFLPWR
ncbi:MAG: AAA family ATPase [Syntrophales bacterium]|jgi:pilus assembly protein CpaE